MASETSYLDRFLASSMPADPAREADLRAYFTWHFENHTTEFTPTKYDDVELRTYLLHLRTEGADRQTLRRTLASLKQFYAWARADGLIEKTPFDTYNFDRPILSRDQIRRRPLLPATSPQEREIARLRALNRIADHLNRSADLQTILDMTLQTLVKVMGLRAAWAFLLTDVGLHAYAADYPPLHEFALVAACGLPPGLARDQCYYLRCAPNCHCQDFFRKGHLKRAVNVVECSRLDNSLEAGGENEGLLFHASVPIIVEGRPLGIVNVATEEWQFLTTPDLQLLSAVGAQVAVALERARLYEVQQAQRVRMERELEMAREVQASLLPSQMPNISGFSLAADWRSAREVSGDFYDLFPLAGGRWALVIGDVSDKGAPAALYMAMVRSLLRATANAANDTPSPAAALMAVNHSLLSQCSAVMFVTMFYAILDPADRSLMYTIAGHNPPLLRRLDGAVETLPRGGLLLGILEDVQLSNSSLRLTPGEALVIYTDGLTDAENTEGTAYGAARLSAAIQFAPRQASSLLAHILNDLDAFARGVPSMDDITLLVVAADPA